MVNKIKPVDLKDYQTKRKNQGYSDSHADREIGAARTVVNEAFMNGKIGGDPVKVFKQVKKLLKRNGNARDRVLTLDEFNGLMSHLPRHAKVLLAIGFYTGMRRGEILNLTWDKVELKGRVIRLEAGDTKDKQGRNVPICEDLYKILLREANPLRKAEDDNRVILYNGKPIGDPRAALRNACEKAHIPYGRNEKNGITFHDLRHTFDTLMRKAGVHDSVIMEITGHSTMEMFQRYNTVDEEDTK